MLRFITSTLTAFALAGTVSVFAQQEQAPAQQQPQAEKQAPKEYVLNNAEGGSAKMYVLGGSAQSDWQTNVNKKVEVTGPVQQPNAPPAEDGAAGKPGVVRPPLMEVESVKVVAETCK
jgi:hypothetical protein